MVQHLGDAGGVLVVLAHLNHRLVLQEDLVLVAGVIELRAKDAGPVMVPLLLTRQLPAAHDMHAHQQLATICCNVCYEDLTIRAGCYDAIRHPCARVCRSGIDCFLRKA